MSASSPTNPSKLADVHAYLQRLLRRQGRRYRRNLRLCQRDFSETAVHDLRVSIRRLSSTVELLSSLLPARQVKKARRALKRQLDAFGELRDTQVQLLRLASLPATDTTFSAFRAYLLKREQTCVRRVRKEVRRMKPGRVVSLLADFEGELKRRRESRRGRRDYEILLHGANESFSRVQALRAQIDPADTDSIHRTRVSFKRFRYRIESLEPLLGELAGRRLRGLRTYQNRMGRIQDATVLLQTAEKFSRRKLPAETGAKFLKPLERAQRRLIRNYLKTADQLNSFCPLPRGDAIANPGTRDIGGPSPRLITAGEDHSKT